jgi:hypothetical protein
MTIQCSHAEAKLMSNPKINPQIIPQIVAALERFDREVMCHAHFEDLTTRVEQRILFARDTRLLALIGPSGVGKSCLVERLARRICEAYREELTANPTVYPIISIRIAQDANPAGSAPAAIWRDAYTKILEQLGEVLIDKKTDPSEHNGKPNFQQDGGSLSLPKFRRTIIRILKERSVKAVIVDEAQHLAVTASGQQMLKQFNAIKSLADEAGIPFLLVGPYELYNYLSTESQVIRRSAFEHFEAYHWGRLEDCKKFKQAVLELQNNLKKILSLDNKLLAHSKELFNLSLGCVGSLTQLIRDAAGPALAEGLTSLDIDFIKKYALPIQERIKLQMAIVTGRNTMSVPPKSDERLENLILTEPKWEDSSEFEPRKNGSVHRRPGRRAPHRDPTGQQELGL